MCGFFDDVGGREKSSKLRSIRMARRYKILENYNAEQENYDSE